MTSREPIKAVVTLVSIGTACWVVAAILFLITGAEAKIVWTCVVGAALGATGIRYSIRRNRRSAI
jgi:hypothetical protein